MVCQPTTVQLIDCNDNIPSPPPTLLVVSRGNGITEQRLCWQRPRQRRAQGRPFTFHPPSTSPKTQEESKVAQMRVSVNVQRELKTGSEQGKRGRKQKRRGGKIQPKEEQQGCWHLCRYIKRKFSSLKIMLNKSGSSSSWPINCRESLMNCSRLSSRLRKWKVVIETAGWLHSHWSCYYTDDCKYEAGRERSGFDIGKTTLAHIKVWNANGESDAVCFLMGGCVRLCLLLAPILSLFPSQTLFHEKGVCVVIGADRQMFIASDTPHTTFASGATLNAFGF